MNSPGHFEVVFNGAGKKSIEDVKQQMGTMFQLDPVKLEALFTGRPVVVKKNLSKEIAEKYKLAIAKAGGISLVTEMDSFQPQIDAADDSDETDEPDEHHSYLITAKTITCPACGHEQLEAESCNSCYINIEEYKEAERLKKKQEKMERWLAAKEKKAQEQPPVLVSVAVRDTLVEEPQEQQPGSDVKKRSLLLPFVGFVVLAAVAVATAFFMGWIQL